MMERVSVSKEMDFMCVKWKPAVNSNNAFHVKIKHICWHSALVRYVGHKFDVKNYFIKSSNGLEREKLLCYKI